MLAVTLTFLVEHMDEVTEAAVPITEQLQQVTIPPVGHAYVNHMANEQGSVANVRVELVPEHQAAMLKLHPAKATKQLIKN